MITGHLARIRSTRADRLSPPTQIEAKPLEFWAEFATEVPSRATKYDSLI
jgi:hypothetical protein